MIDSDLYQMAQVPEESCASCSQAENNILQAHLLFHCAPSTARLCWHWSWWALSSRTCVSQTLCVAHVTGDSSILCAPTTSLFPCFLFFGQDSPLCLLGLPCPGGWKGNVLQHYREISFLPFALNKRVPFQHLPSATDLPCSAEQWETHLPQPASLLLLCAYLTWLAMCTACKGE